MSDGVVTLRLPSAGDADGFVQIAGPGQDSWIGPPRPGQSSLDWASAYLSKLVAGWNGDGSIYGGGLVIGERVPFAGVVSLYPRAPRVLELSYFVGRIARGRGVASRAARLCSDWALGDGGYERVEIRADRSNIASQRVAENAGFTFVEVFRTFVEGTGNWAEDVLYVRTVVHGTLQEQ